jgi:glycosyltransferase involved in cell wall biosynthesis
VVSDRGALPEVVGDAGVVVPPDAAAVAQGLRSVLTDPERAADLGARGRARAAGFGWDAMVAVWSEVLHEAAEDR